MTARAKNAQKRVLIIVENLPVPFDRRVWQEATSLRDAGYMVSVICPTGHGYPRRRETTDGIRIYRHPNPFEAKSFLGYLVEYPWALLCELMLSFRVMMSGGFDAIHACNPPDLIFLVAAAHKFLFGKKFVFDQHDINPEMYMAMGGSNPVALKALYLCEKLSFRLADVSIAPNESYAKIAVERGGKKQEDVFVVRSNPKATDYDSRSEAGTPKELLRPQIKKRVGYVGVMGRQDSVDVLLRAADYIVNGQGRKEVQFVLIGDGPSMDTLKALTSDLGLEHNVVFTGWVPETGRLARILSACDVCAVPDAVTQYSTRSTMNKTMEYMALGKPMVQFDNIEGRYSALEASLYAEPGNELDFAQKIIRLLDTPSLCERMGRFGRARIRSELNWSVSERALLSAYDRLFSK